MTKIVGSKKEEFERIRRHHEAFGTGTWNPNGLDPEPRACMILNRFSRNLNIMYASPSCEFVFDVEPDLIVDKPFLLYIRADDLASFVEQVDMAKSSNVVTHMRFWFQSPMCQTEIPCEAMLFGAADGLVAVLRRCRPFVRKRLITIGLQESKSGIGLSADYGNGRRSSSEYFASSSSACSSFTSGSGVPGTTPNYANIHNNGRMSSGSNQASMSSPSISSCGSSFTSSSSASSYLQYPYVPSSYSYCAPLRGLSIGSINSIRNLDREHRNVRPLTSLHVDGAMIEEETSSLPETYRLRTHHIKEDDMDDDDDADADADADEYVDLNENQYRGYIQDSGLEVDMGGLYMNEIERHNRRRVLVEDADDVQEVLEEWIPIWNGKESTYASRSESGHGTQSRSTSRSKATNQRGSS